MRFFRSSNKYVALILVLLGMASVASAAIIAPEPPNIQFTMKLGDGVPYGLPATITPVQVGDKWRYEVDGSYNQHGYEMTLHFVIDPDPSVSGNIVVKNNLPTTQTFTLSNVTPVGVPFNPSLLNGSVGVTLTSDDTAGTVATAAPDAIYTALIDGIPVKTLLNHPFSLSAPAFDSAVATDRFGIPIPEAGGAVNATIGINLKFTLTPGDQVGITSQFTANPVPEPTTLLGLAIGGLALVRRRK
ncbi:MAG TPA: PEP-CTERM sorting domain-containing protein [Tepidisphaeraceae bacterium]|jgi:hypothetical protein|nr:PEP-CTERM sorting domain-containing protein [Tepidisphaeraceae bacterium]